MSPPTCRACCPSCGLHFAGQTAFDAHLGGERNGWAHHHPLDVVDFEERPRFDREEGVCRMAAAAPRPVWVWYLHAERARARAHFDREPALERQGVRQDAISGAGGSPAPPRAAEALRAPTQS